MCVRHGDGYVASPFDDHNLPGSDIFGKLRKTKYRYKKIQNFAFGILFAMHYAPMESNPVQDGEWRGRGGHAISTEMDSTDNIIEKTTKKHI
jgi:hypothetical protein